MRNKLRERERERERSNLFLCEKTIHRMKEKMSNIQEDVENKKSQNKEDKKAEK